MVRAGGHGRSLIGDRCGAHGRLVGLALGYAADMTPDRLLIAPEVAARACRRHARSSPSSPPSSATACRIPQNIEVASASEAAVRESGAIPATVAIHDGRVLVGLDAGALRRSRRRPPGRSERPLDPSLAIALAEGGWAATTVSATMIAAEAAGIRVFATGGIGGVHRGALGRSRGRIAPATFDISSDLEELGRTAVAVVCAGPKAILDVPATLEYLETRGVPVVAVGQEDVPGFYARSSGIKAPATVPDIAAAARLVALHLQLGRSAAGSWSARRHRPISRSPSERPGPSSSRPSPRPMPPASRGPP